jgi:type I restriction enzyme S subunit
MGSETQEYRLEDCMEAIIDYRGKTPKKTDAGVPLITAKIIKNGRVLPFTEYIAEDDYDSWMTRGFPEAGDVVLTTEAPLGEVAQLDGQKVALAQRVITLRGKKDLLDNDYLLYLLQSRDVQHQLDGRGTGSTVKGIKQSELRQILFRLPSINVQKKIAEQLTSIDHKLLLNREINQTLEQMSQALFKSWFVDFDPVIDNVLDAGNPIPDALTERAALRQAARASDDFQPLPDDIRQLFPSKFEESELGLVPKGWGCGFLNDIAEFGKERISVDCLSLEKYISTENMLQGKKGVEKASKLPTVSNALQYKSGTILVSNIRPYFKKIWFAKGQGGYSNDVLGFEVKNEGTQTYLFNLLYQDVFFDYMMTTSKGSKMPRGDKKAIMDLKITIPSISIMEFYSKKIEPIYEAAEIRRNENKVLVSIRETLLPKLISGELRLDSPEVEKAKSLLDGE